ncbi:MAG: serine kinase of the HPr protein regulates carbohydrate metabolism [Phenylobacterium sp.]|nr:serine kinase of the HPr protein regulates carbohydrate metabolism [Phenylobacterium sp.]
MIAHAGLLAQRIGGRWKGALIEGPSGAGKSDLAIRALEAGFRLVADDRVLLWAADGRLFGRAPDALKGLIEVRGLDVVRDAALPFCEIVLVVQPGAPERLPEPAFADRLAVRLPAIVLPYREASAPAKLGRALAALYVSGQRRM